MEKFKIVADSSSDLLELSGIPFSSAPLKILTSDAEYVDDKALDVRNMVETLAKYKGKSSTSCPNPEDWLKAFGDAQYIFCITITGTLSGSFNAATIAKEMYESSYPERKVFVINSLSTGPEMKLIIENICQLILDGCTYEEICNKTSEYCKNTGLIFMLESMKNLANNGRVSPIVAKAAGLLGIRLVGKASDQGDLQPLNKCRGQDRALIAILEQMKELGYKGGKVRIAHCFNEQAALKLKEMLCSQNFAAEIEVYGCRGLCSFYAEKGGLLVGFEKC